MVGKYKRIDIDKLKKFFEDNKLCGNHELARMAKVRLPQITEWKKLCGIHKPRKNFRFPGIYKPAARNVERLPEGFNWDNPEWFREQYEVKRFGVNSICKMTGKNPGFIYRRLKRYEIKIRNTTTSRLSQNKYFNKEWLIQHIINEGMTLKTVAKIAGVRMLTVQNWLVRFDIQTRDINNAIHIADARIHNTKTLRPNQTVNIDIRIKKLVDNLKHHPLVESAEYNFNEVKVNFKHGLVESWLLPTSDQKKLWPYCGMYHFERLPEDLKDIDQISKIPIRSEFNISSLDPNYDSLKHLFIVKKSDYRGKNIPSIRMMVHNLINEILARGWKDIKYPEDIVINDYDKLRNYNLNKFFYSGLIRVLEKKYVGMRLIEHFMPMGDVGINRTYKEAWVDPTTLRVAITDLINKRKSITIRNIMSAITRAKNPKREVRFRILSPNMYRLLFKTLGVSGKVADITPCYGSKAIACAIENIDYYKINHLNDNFTALLKFLGVNHNIIKDEIYDWILLDNDMRDNPSLLKNVKEWKDKAKNIFLFVLKERSEELKSILQPKRIYNIQSRVNTELGPDSIFIL